MPDETKPVNGRRVYFQPFVAFLVIIGSFGSFYLVAFGLCDTAWEKVIFVIIGALLNQLGQIVQFYFGTSLGSERKTEMLAGK